MTLGRYLHKTNRFSWPLHPCNSAAWTASVPPEVEEVVAVCVADDSTETWADLAEEEGSSFVWSVWIGLGMAVHQATLICTRNGIIRFILISAHQPRDDHKWGSTHGWSPLQPQVPSTPCYGQRFAVGTTNDLVVRAQHHHLARCCHQVKCARQDTKASMSIKPLMRISSSMSWP